MADYVVSDTSLTTVANAIRTKGGTSASLSFPDGFASAIAAIPTGGGGGASNVVTGTFTGTTSDTAIDVSLNYSGSGYPVAVLIYPSEGAYNSGSGTFYSLIQRYAMDIWSAVKINVSSTPDFTDETGSPAENKMMINARYKNSTSSATSYTAGGSQSINVIINKNAVTNATGPTTCVRIKSATKMSVFICSSGYGFATNIEYRYWVLYSS